MRPNIRSIGLALLCIGTLLPVNRAAGNEGTNVPKAVAHTVGAVMTAYGIPGMAVGIVTSRSAYVYDYGVASTATKKPVGAATLFEIGSISKTFTATLASYAQITGKLSLSDPASKYLPSLRGTSFDRVSLLNLGTHTSGGLPLQVPDGITNDTQLTAYLQTWKPVTAPGTHRLYSNVSIGLLGMISAKTMDADFTALMQEKLFPWLGLNDTFIDLPPARMADYAQGYTVKDTPIRMAPGVLGAQAYGIRSTAGNMLRFVEANMGMLHLDGRLQRAINATHTGYYRIGAMTQDLIWEQYQYPLDVEALVEGNSAKVSLGDNPVSALDRPSRPRADVLIDKTGSTNGFAAYVAFIPEKKLGVVLLANKNYPIEARVRAAAEILTELAKGN